MHFLRGVFLMLTTVYPTFERLNVSGCVNITIPGIEEGIARCHQLRHLDYSEGRRAVGAPAWRR
jgi:hypothetical protein